MSKVSIIIPAFNQGRFLAAAIESALGQTHPDMEVVVIDDGSTDDTPEVAGRFAGRIKYVRQENAGLPSARNRGWKESSGDYVCFLDSDDFYDTEKISRQAEILDSDSAVDWVYCDIVTVDELGEPVAEQTSVSAPGRQMSGDIFQTLILAGYFPPHTVMIRRCVLESVGGFDPELGGHADYELWLRVAAAGHQAVFVDERLASYRTYPTSMSKDGRHMDETRQAAFRKIARLHPDRVADGLHRLQHVSQDLFLANEWLKKNWQGVFERVGGAGHMRPGKGERCSLLKQLSSARLTSGRGEQQAVWDVTLNGAADRALLLQPPAELAFNLPTGARGTLTTAVSLHPDVWTNPQSGGCEFYVRVNGRIAFVLALDPVRLPADRRWHEIVLDVPEISTGRHQVIFETKQIGSIEFRWALWRDPYFTAHDTAEAAGRAISPQPFLLQVP